jgi:hypothetical protein
MVPLAPAPPGDAFALIVPAMVTLPLASSVTGVLAALRVKVTVTPAGMLIVVKLNTPLGGRVSVVLVVGLSAPSAPVLPLLNVWADAGPPRVAIITKTRLIASLAARPVGSRSNNRRLVILIPSFIH